MKKIIACYFWDENPYINKERKKKAFTSTVSSEQSAREYCRIYSRLFPSSVCPCWPGSGNAQYRVPSRQVISLRGPLCRSGSTVGPQNSAIKTYIYNKQ